MSFIRRRKKLFGVLAVVLCVGCPLGSGAFFLASAIISLATGQDFQTALLPQFGRTGDSNNDGRPDVVTANTGDDNLTILVNNTTAGSQTLDLNTTVNVPVGAGSDPVAVVLADLNGDGLLDLASANIGTDDVSIFRNASNPGDALPTYVAAGTLTPGADPVSIVAADFNKDGRLDLAVANAGPDTVSVFLNTTTTATNITFSGPDTFATGVDPASLFAADFTGDGRADLAVASRGGNMVSILANQTAPLAATASFAARVDFATGTAPASVVAVDLNGDGRMDLAVANSGDNTVSLLMNTIAAGEVQPAFAAKTDFGTGATPSDIAVADLDGDGRMDLALSNSGDNTVSVFANQTEVGSMTAALAPPTNAATGAMPMAVAADDLNGDLRADLVSVNTGASTVTAIVNTTAVPAPPSSLAFRAPAVFPTVAATPTQGDYTFAFGDLNQDGAFDIVVTNDDEDTISVIVNTTAIGATTATAAATLRLPAGDGPRGVGIADMNADGKNDIVVVATGQGGGNGDEMLIVFFNNTPAGQTPTAGNFVADPSPIVFDQSLGMSDASYLDLGDFNADGRLDVASFRCCGAGNGVTVFLNNTAGGSTDFTISNGPGGTSFAVAGAPGDVEVADFNADGKLDLAVISVMEVRFLRNTTANGAATPTFVDGGGQAVPTADGVSDVADFNGDGLPDSFNNNENDGSTTLLLNTVNPRGGPTFSFARLDLTGIDADGSPGAGDINNDGRLDLVTIVRSGDPRQALILINTTSAGASQPSFSTQVTLDTGIVRNPSGMGPDIGETQIADFNRDNKPDLIILTNSEVRVYLQQ